MGLIDPLLLLPTIVALALLGLRDKTIFLAARGEHYWLKLVIFFFPFTDQIAAFKIVMLGLWWGAAISKLNHHFPYVVAAMTSNNALLRGKAFNWLKRRLYRDPVNDIRPTWIPKVMAHVGGTTAELIVPAVLVFVAGNHPWRWALIAFMVIFHLNIISNLPMGVPLGVEHLFHLLVVLPVRALRQHRDLRPQLAAAAGDIAGGPCRDPGRGKHVPATDFILAGVAVLRGQLGVECLVLPRGRGGQDRGRCRQELRADRQTDCPALRHGYRGDHQRQSPGLPVHACPRSRAQRAGAAGAGKTRADYALREGETVAGPLIGWNFGEGHLHNEQLVEAVQRRCQLDEGDLRVIILEGQPIQTKKQRYRIVDAKTGLIEEGYVAVDDMLARQPWPEPGDELPVHPITTR